MSSKFVESLRPKRDRIIQKDEIINFRIDIGQANTADEVIAVVNKY